MSKADLQRDERVLWLCRTCGQWSTDSEQAPEVHTLSVSEGKVPDDLEWVEHPTERHPWGDMTMTFFRADAPPLAWSMMLQEWESGAVKRYYYRICGDYEPWVARRIADGNPTHPVG